jgi:integrase
MTDRRKASGFVRVVERGGGPVFYALIRTPDGRRLQRRLGPAWHRRSRPPEGYVTRAQAEARLQEILAGRDPAVPVEAPPDSEATFGMAAAEWMRYVEHDRKRRPSTVLDYKREIRRNLLPAFGANTPLSSIRTADIDAYREQLVAEGRLGARTINKRLAQLHAIFRRAQRVYGLASNPVAGAERQPYRRSGDFSVLEPQEVELLAASASNDQDAVIFTVAAFSGLRLGELRALRWGDVDWLLRLIHVRRSYVEGSESVPKSGRVRSVPLVDQAARALDRLSRRERWTEEDDLVFVNPVGGVIEDSALRRRFYASLDRAGLERIRFHDLRHTFGTIAVQAFPLSDVKAYMGHADIQTTMIYVHHVPRHDAADRLTELLDARVEGQVGCTPGARSGPDEEAEEPENAPEQAISDAGGRTRTCDTRIMIPLL